MASVSQKAAPEEVLPLLARNVEVQGFQYSQGRAHQPTEYLILLKRYLEQARQLRTLAGMDGIIRVPGCTDAQPLLAIRVVAIQYDVGIKIDQQQIKIAVVVEVGGCRANRICLVIDTPCLPRLTPATTNAGPERVTSLARRP